MIERFRQFIASKHIDGVALTTIAIGIALAAVIVFIVKLNSNDTVVDKFAEVGQLPKAQLVSATDLKKGEGELFDYYYDSGQESATVGARHFLGESSLSEYLRKLVLQSTEKTQKTDVYVISGKRIDNALKNVDKNGYQLYVYAPFVISGKNIYFFNDELTEVNKQRAYVNLLTGLMLADGFKSISSSKIDEHLNAKQKYGNKDLWFLQSYAYALGLDLDNWKNPYPQKTSEYIGQEDLCKDVNEALNLFDCELALVENGKASLLPPTSQKYFSDIGFAADANYPNTYKFTGVLPEDAFNKINPVTFQTSTIIYTQWQFTAFGKDSKVTDQQTSNKAYSNVVAGSITDLVKALKARGWTLDLETQPQADPQFAATQKAYYFTKEVGFYRQEITLRTLNTSELNADCIVEGSGKPFCDTHAITKGTNYYLLVSIAAEEI
jgi:hypothetical protein